MYPLHALRSKSKPSQEQVASFLTIVLLVVCVAFFTVIIVDGVRDLFGQATAVGFVVGVLLGAIAVKVITSRESNG